MKEKIKELSKNFFEKLEIIIDSIDVTEEEKNIFLIKIKSPDSGLLIGPHWKNIDSIQHLLKLISSNNYEEKIKIHLEINDYRKSKDDRLKSFINSKIKYVEKSSNDLKLPFYSAYNRKKIHWFVWDYWNDKIYTKSIENEMKEDCTFVKKTIN